MSRFGRSHPPLEEIQVPEGTEVDIAFDLSSSTVGWAVGVDRTPVAHGRFVFKTTAKTGEKLFEFDHFLTQLFQIVSPTAVIAEQPLSGRGHTTARHYELLGVVRKECQAFLGEEVIVIPVREIKNVMMVQSGGKHQKNKQIMVQKINHLLGLSLTEEDNDSADAYAVLITHWRQTAFRESA